MAQLEMVASGYSGLKHRLSCIVAKVSSCLLAGLMLSLFSMTSPLMAEQYDGFSGERRVGFFGRLAVGGYSAHKAGDDYFANDGSQAQLIADEGNDASQMRSRQNGARLAQDLERNPLEDNGNSTEGFVPPPIDETFDRPGGEPLSSSKRDAGESDADQLAEQLSQEPAVPAVQNPIRAAILAYREKRVEDAVLVLESAADNGSFIARFLLAHLYRTGKAGAVDHAKAYRYYHQITSDFADNSRDYTRVTPFVAHAFVQLARYREIGVPDLNVLPDPLVARILFEKAAHFGDVEGQYQLGRFLIETGQMRNIKLGQRWLTRAAIKNNPKAQAYLGALYWQGDLVKRKQGLALAWIEFARRNATGSVKNHVERLYEAVRYDMTEEEHNRAALFIGKLRSKYNVLWRDVPAKQSPVRELLDGIVLAEPPQGLDTEQLEAKTPRNQLPELGQHPEGFRQNEASSFGYQMFGLGARPD